MHDLSIDPLDWSTIEPHFTALHDEPLTVAQVPAWLARWSDVDAAILQGFSETMRAMNEDTTDAAAAERFQHFTSEIQPRADQAAQKLRARLLALGSFEPPNAHREFLRRLRNTADLFVEANVALQADEQMRASDYMKLSGALTVMLDGEEMTVPQAETRLLDPDRSTRETAWRAIWSRRLADRDALHALLLDLVALRRQIAANAGVSDYRAFRWRQLNRLDYTPEQAQALHAAIEAEVVPLAARLAERRRQLLGVATLRPWDLGVDPQGRPALHPFTTADELEAGVARIVGQIDPILGAQFERMRDGYLDLASRKAKSLLGFSTFFPRFGMPYIFMNAVGTNADIRILLHEAGHAFHSFALAEHQPLMVYADTPLEFMEVASQAMELLALPYLAAEHGGFYAEEDVPQAVCEQVEWVLSLLRISAAYDALQHWLYTSAPEDVTVMTLEAKAVELHERFFPGEDWSGLTKEQAINWQQYMHPFAAPFYMIEYALAMLGALQIWRNALQDQPTALAHYRAALSMGGTRSVPELYRAAGASLVFDRPAVADLMHLLAAHIGL